MPKTPEDLNTTCWCETAEHRIRMHSSLLLVVRQFLLIVLAGHPMHEEPGLEKAPY